MQRASFLATFAVVTSVCVSQLLAIDTIIRQGAAGLSGDIQRMTAEEVTIKTSRGEEKVPTSEIVRIRFNDEPASINLARGTFVAGRYEEALESFKKLEDEQFTGNRVLELKQDLQFYVAYATGKLALSGAKDLGEAEQLLSKFVDEHTSNYHWLDAVELLGDVRVASRKFAEAESAYSRLTTSQLPGYKMRGLVARGNALLEQDKAAPALASFESVLSMDAGDDETLQRHKHAAQLGKGAALAAQGKLKDAVTIVEGVIANAPEEGELYARAYNTLGFCYQQSNKEKEAMLAFLHVDVLYNNYPQEHAKALFNLVDLWTKLNKADYAKEARESLQQRYPNSPYSKQLN